MQNFVEKAFKNVEDAVGHGLNKSDSSIAELFDQWLLEKAKYPQLAHPVRRPPASLAQIENAETRLGFVLPKQLKELFLVSDGVDWVVPTEAKLLARDGYFPPISALSLASELTKPLSVFVEESRRRGKQRGEVSDAVEIGEPGIWSFLAPPIQRIEFDVLDTLIALQIPNQSTCLLMVPCLTLDLVPGTILDFEGLRATRYESLAHWMSVQIELSRCLP